MTKPFTVLIGACTALVLSASPAHAGTSHIECAGPVVSIWSGDPNVTGSPDVWDMEVAVVKAGDTPVDVVKSFDGPGGSERYTLVQPVDAGTVVSYEMWLVSGSYRYTPTVDGVPVRWRYEAPVCVAPTTTTVPITVPPTVDTTPPTTAVGPTTTVTATSTTIVPSWTPPSYPLTTLPNVLPETGASGTAALLGLAGALVVVGFVARAVR